MGLRASVGEPCSAADSIVPADSAVAPDWKALLVDLSSTGALKDRFGHPACSSARTLSWLLTSDESGQGWLLKEVWTPGQAGESWTQGSAVGLSVEMLVWFPPGEVSLESL